MKISIITTAKNSVKTIEDTILSVISQTYKNVEYIVIDGGSTDGTLEIIKKHSQFIDYWKSEPDNGIYNAFNKGISIATGEYVGLLNSDDYYHSKDVLETLVQNILSNGQDKIYHANMVTIDKNKNIIRRYLYSSKKISERYQRTPFCHPTMFVPLNLYSEIGLFQEKYKIAGDYEFILRALKNNIKFYHINQTFVCMRVGGFSSKLNYLLPVENFKAKLSNNCPFLYGVYFFLIEITYLLLRKIKRFFIPSKFG